MAHVYSIRRIPISWYLGLVWLRTFMYVYVQLDTLVLMVSSYHSHDTKSCSHLIMSNISSIEFRAHRIVSVCVYYKHFPTFWAHSKFNEIQRSFDLLYVTINCCFHGSSCRCPCTHYFNIKCAIKHLFTIQMRIRAPFTCTILRQSARIHFTVRYPMYSTNAEMYLYR